MEISGNVVIIYVWYLDMLNMRPRKEVTILTKVEMQLKYRKWYVVVRFLGDDNNI